MTKTNVKDKIGKSLFMAAAVICVISVVTIFIFLIVKSAPALKKIGFFDFLFGTEWSPDKDATYDKPLTGSYGVAKMIAGTLAATLGAIITGGITGYFTAVFLAFYCPKKIKKFLCAAINLLAGIPSVVYGFFGISFVLPLLSNIAPNGGDGLMATSIILGIMILPTVVSLSRTALEAVPKSYYEGSVSLGANHNRTVFSVMSPAAKSGIFASLILGIGRALGETMAVVMVAGNSVAYPKDLFTSFRVLTANIVLEMGYAGEVQTGALIASGVVLLVFVLITNLAFGLISGKIVVKAVNKGTSVQSADGKIDKTAGVTLNQKIKNFFAPIGSFCGKAAYKLHLSDVKAALAIICGVLAASSLAIVIGFIMVKGVPELVKDPAILYRKYEFGMQDVTIYPAIITTLETVTLSLLISVPIGIMTAIFLNEYAKQGNVFVKIIRSAIDVLAGVPSIVFGLFGMIVFVPAFGGSGSLIAGTLTISMMLLPVIVRSTEESLKTVPDSLREGSLALGAGKVRTIFRIVLPSALPGILSAVILSAGRVISESAPFIYTMGSIIRGIPKNLTDGGTTLAVALYRLAGEGWHIGEAYATAVVLVVIVLALTLTSEIISEKLSKKIRGN